MSRFERWSRAKRGLPVDDEVKGEHPAAEGPPPEAPEPNHQAVEDNQAAEDNEASEAPAKEVPPEPGSLDHTLPDPDTLAADSDFSAFMAPGVSSALRRKALRRLWSTGDYNVRDGLNDYDHDFKAQMKPMAAEMADKVRQWTKKVEEALEEPEDKSATQPLGEPAEERTAEIAEESDDRGEPYPNVEQPERGKQVGK
ncbi:DUF3306 domain-containing protein [Vreelandella massiliensis]|uniref:DUF3306 domain-containing protein n=1 Tax=Vreelandella massiliensis TaxID=1816686 RepID=UPI00096A27F0|nr:DUF3306 domain-containing protein [Halomonas massiliensis]MYL24716.1 DUF3306 domain-containing protein [Halomonas alkaliantarctica]